MEGVILENLAVGDAEAGATVNDLSALEFLERYTFPVDGWLQRYAAIRTIDLLDWQEARGVRGPLLEIGVFAGKYATILIRAGLRTGDSVFGLDTFQYLSTEDVLWHLRNVPGKDLLRFIQGMSTDFNASDLIARLGAKPRFISIDGSHDCDDVFWDFCLAEQILGAEGVIAADDFMNSVALGVNEAVHKFFATPRNLAPFAFTSNKLFLCRPAMAKTYRDIFEGFIVGDDNEPKSATFRDRMKHGRSHVEQPLWGRPVLVP